MNRKDLRQTPGPPPVVAEQGAHVDAQHGAT